MTNRDLPRFANVRDGGNLIDDLDRAERALRCLRYAVLAAIIALLAVMWVTKGEPQMQYDREHHEVMK